jgi:hypothetical protein
MVIRDTLPMPRGAAHLRAESPCQREVVVVLLALQGLAHPGLLHHVPGPAEHVRVAPGKRPCGQDRASPKNSSPKPTLNKRTLYSKSQKVPISSPRLASPIKLGLALSGAPGCADAAAEGRVVGLVEAHAYEG